MNSRYREIYFKQECAVRKYENGRHEKIYGKNSKKFNGKNMKNRNKENKFYTYIK